MRARLRNRLASISWRCREGALPLGAATSPASRSAATVGPQASRCPGAPVPAANTATATAGSPQAPRAPQARQLQDPRKLTVFLLRTRHGGVTSRASFNEVSRRARRSGLSPASSARKETPRPALPRPARKRTRLTAACLGALQAGALRRPLFTIFTQPQRREGRGSIDIRGETTGTNQVLAWAWAGEGFLRSSSSNTAFLPSPVH